jgi:hypothetical protein
MDTCVTCGQPINKPTSVESHVMATFVNRQTKEKGIFNRGDKEFTVYKPGPVDPKTGEATKVAVVWVHEKVWDAEQEAIKAKADADAAALKAKTPVK